MESRWDLPHVLLSNLDQEGKKICSCTIVDAHCVASAIRLAENIPLQPVSCLKFPVCSAWHTPVSPQLTPTGGRLRRAASRHSAVRWAGRLSRSHFPPPAPQKHSWAPKVDTLTLPHTVCTDPFPPTQDCELLAVSFSLSHTHAHTHTRTKVGPQ